MNMIRTVISLILMSNNGLFGDLELKLHGLGTLKGGYGVARDNEEYFQFLGVPYADPPIRDRRFRNPIPVTSWDGVKDATRFGSACIQMSYFSPLDVVGSEDCLFLNIFTKNVTTKKPVLVYIHGGSFILGDTTRQTGEYLLEEDIVLVTIQYRLGPMGWLTTADSVASGNYGLQDQILALRWVQEHIDKFGGDKDLVTVAGGGASVNYLLLSPKTHGLFHRAVAMSGSALAHWASLPRQEETAVRLANALNCPTSSSATLIACLQKIPASKLMSAQAKLYAWHHDKMEKEPMTIWSPRPDPEAGESAVLPQHPELAMTNSHVQPLPLLVGVAESEGVWKAANYLTQDKVISEILHKFDDIAKHALGLINNVEEDHLKTVLKKIKNYYLGVLYTETDFKKMLDGVVTGMINMFGDAAFNYPIDKMVKLLIKTEQSPVWMYQFNYKHNHSLVLLDPKNSGQIRTLDDPALLKATHAHECSMLFPEFVAEMGPLSDEEVQQSKRFIKLIVSFMNGNHLKEFRNWTSIRKSQLSYLVFDKKLKIMKNLPHQERIQFWDALQIFWKKQQVSSISKSEL